MFTRQELKEFLKKLKLEKGEYCVIAGGSLLMHGLKEETEDIDIHVSEKQFNILKEKYGATKTDKTYTETYDVVPDLEVSLYNMDDLNIFYINGIPCTSIFKDYKWRKSVNREKDKAIIEKEENLFSEIADYYSCRVGELTESKIEEYMMNKLKEQEKEDEELEL